MFHFQFQSDPTLDMIHMFRKACIYLQALYCPHFYSQHEFVCIKCEDNGKGFSGGPRMEHCKTVYLRKYLLKS